MHGCCLKYLYLALRHTSLFFTDVLSDISLGIIYLCQKHYHAGATTLFWVLLPPIATILVNYLEEKLKVKKINNRCYYYLRYLAPVSNWRRYIVHKRTHTEDERQKEISELLCQQEELNASILEDITACFQDAPQLIFQLSIIFKSLSEFDGNLVAAVNLTNSMKLFSIFTSAWSIISAIYGKMEYKQFNSSDERIKERNLALACLCSRVLFLLCYSIVICIYTPLLLVIGTSHLFSWFISRVISQEREEFGCAILCEGIVHIFQYILWGRKAVDAVRILIFTMSTEYLVFIGILSYALLASASFGAEYIIIFIVAFITYSFVFSLFMCFAYCKFYCK